MLLHILFRWWWKRRRRKVVENILQDMDVLPSLSLYHNTKKK